MSRNANTVNIKKPPPEKRSYHHGDLRAALIDTGMALIEQRDAEQLSLREVARLVGVSAPAVYRHFPDKAALIEALALEGLNRLGAAQMAAAARETSPVDAFNAIGRAYVRFAIAHPALFRMMMSFDPDAQHFAHIPAGAANPMKLLRETVASLAPPGTSSEMLRIVVLRAWSQVHGLAMLMLDGQVPEDDALIEGVIESRTFWG